MRGVKVFVQVKMFHENPIQINAIQMQKIAKGMLAYQKTWYPTDIGMNLGLKHSSPLSSLLPED